MVAECPGGTDHRYLGGRPTEHLRLAGKPRQRRWQQCLPAACSGPPPKGP